MESINWRHAVDAESMGLLDDLIFLQLPCWFGSERADWFGD